MYREYVVLEPVAAETATQPAQPERLRVGEYAKVISVGVIDDSTPESWVKVGDVFEITTDDGSSTPFRGKQVLSGETAWFKAERFVRATDDEVAAAKYALKLGDFKGGGYAVIENPSDDNASTGVRLSKGKYVIVSEFGPEGVRALTIENPDSTTLGFANADALRKVTKEEFDAATAPKPTFEVGDTVKLSLTEGQRPKHGFGEVENGDIGKVASVSNSLITVDFPSQSGWSAKPNELTKLTAEESAEIERNKAEEAAREAERAKWAKIGREVNEFKRGDIVEVMESGSSGYRVGLVDVVTHGDDDVLRLSTGTDRTCPWIVSRRVKLVVPVEQRFDQSA
ncbi:hypothetical protein [Paenibacillus sp. PDC88]|uniref:hypothetical protein n=1 Tax=Paenibacillus sp. PDC88 TaxID=1884375 RepID=UPI00115FFF70|nr:hypothetical protein [Paenibacillus sp. PDC88]